MSKERRKREHTWSIFSIAAVVISCTIVPTENLGPAAINFSISGSWRTSVSSSSCGCPAFFLRFFSSFARFSLSFCAFFRTFVSPSSSVSHPDLPCRESRDGETTPCAILATNGVWAKGWMTGIWGAPVGVGTEDS